MSGADHDWRLYYDPEGHPYLYNHRTGESQWADSQSLTEPDPTAPQFDDIEYEGEEEGDDDDSDLGSTESESVSSEDIASTTSSFDEFLMSDEGWAQFEREQGHIARQLKVDTSLQIYNFVDGFRKRWFTPPSPDEVDELNSYEIDEALSEVSSSDSDVKELRSPILPPVIISLSHRLHPALRESYSFVSSLAVAAELRLQQSPFYMMLRSLLSRLLMRKRNLQEDNEIGSSI